MSPRFANSVILTHSCGIETQWFHCYRLCDAIEILKKKFAESGEQFMLAQFYNAYGEASYFYAGILPDELGSDYTKQI